MSLKELIKLSIVFSEPSKAYSCVRVIRQGQSETVCGSSLFPLHCERDGNCQARFKD